MSEFAIHESLLVLVLFHLCEPLSIYTFLHLSYLFSRCSLNLAAMGQAIANVINKTLLIVLI